MLNTIVFDLGEVLVQGMVGLDAALQPLLCRSQADIWKSLNCEHKGQFFRGLATEEEYLAAVLNGAKGSCDMERLKAAIRAHFTEIPGTRRIVESLKVQGYNLGLLSVHGREWIEYCERQHGYRDLFNAVHYSFHIGVCKPAPEAYENILAALGALPEHSLFIDDNTNNVAAARRVGMTGIDFFSADLLRNDLRAFGIVA